MITQEDVQCPCHRCEEDPLRRKMMSEDMLKAINIMETNMRFPMVITSGVRCREHNTDVGGKENSQHLIGLAFDVAIKYSVDCYDLVRIAMVVPALERLITMIEVAPKHVHFDGRQGFNRLITGEG